MKEKINLIVKLIVIMTLIMQWIPLNAIAETLAQNPPTETMTTESPKIEGLKGQELQGYLETLSESQQVELMAQLTEEQKASLDLLTKHEGEQGTTESQTSTSTPKPAEEPAESTEIEQPEKITEEEGLDRIVESVAAEEEEAEPTEEEYIGADVNFLSAGPLMSSLEQGEDDNLVLHKTATYNPVEHAVDFQLEAYAKGKIVTQMTPTDIVFVLDVSGSMRESIDGRWGKSKLTALKEAVISFADSLAASQGKLGADQYHTMRIVTYSNTANTTQTTYRTNTALSINNFKSAINNLSANGGTRQDRGLSAAQAIVAANQGNTARTANQAVILFTDGEPDDSNVTKSYIAGEAVNVANTIKNSGNATVYSVGIQNNANPNSIVKTDIPNSMLNGISSNYPDAWVENVSRYTRDLNLGSRNPNGNYYLTTNNATDLNQIFQEIATQIGKIDNLTIRDILTQELVMPTLDSSEVDLSSVKVYQAWTYDSSARQLDSAQVSFDPLTKALDVKNINLQPIIFNSNHEPTPETKNNKLIIRFQAKVQPDFMGGNQITTNEELSGAYGNRNGIETVVQYFTQPKVNIPLKDGDINVTDQKVYLGNITQIGNFFTNLNKINGLNNSHVTLNYTIAKNGIDLFKKEVPAGQAFVDEDFTSLQEEDDDALFEISYEIKSALPAPAGTTGVQSLTKHKNSKIYIFRPVVTVPAQKIYLTNTLTTLGKEPKIVKWEHPKMAELQELPFVGEVPSIVKTEIAPLGELKAEKVLGKVSAIQLSNKKRLLLDLEFPIYVFRPTIISSNATIDLGQTISLSQRHKETKWLNSLTSGDDIQGSQPKLTLRAQQTNSQTVEEDNVSPLETTDYYWNVKANNQEISSESVFQNTDYHEGQQPADAHFTVYVKTASLVIEKTIVAEERRSFGDESFLFEVIWQDEEQTETYLAVVTLGSDQTSGQARLENLKSGSYTVREVTAWSSRYVGSPEQQLQVTTETVGKVNFTNTLKNSKWLSYETTVANKFNQQSEKRVDK